MIDDHIIRKALDAWIGDHNCPHPDQIRAYRVLITRSLEAVAADIWDEGWEQGMAYVMGMERGTDDDHAITNPYRTKETAWRPIV